MKPTRFPLVFFAHQTLNFVSHHYWEVPASNIATFISRSMKSLLQFLSDTYELSRNYLLANPGIVGVILGFFLSQGSTYIKERGIAKRLAKAVRKLIELEIEHNLNLLCILSQEVEFARENNDIFMQSLSFPTWQRRGFESNLSTLPGALSEDKLVRVLKFYREMDQLIDIYSRMKALEQERRSVINAINEAEFSGNGMRRLFISTFGFENVEMLEGDYFKQLAKFEQLLKEAQLEGNPLSSESVSKAIVKGQDIKISKTSCPE